MYSKVERNGEQGHFSVNLGQKPSKNSEVKRLLFIDSRDLKNTSGYKSPFDYVVKLEDRTTTQSGSVTVHEGIGIEPYKNISKMQLKMISIPKMNNREHYVILDIPEISDHIDSTDRGSHRSSAIVNFTSNKLEPGVTRPNFENYEFGFNAPLQVLSQMNIRILRHNGIPITDADYGSVDPEILFTSMMFEITYNPLLF
jgi:hypothetical protein